MSASLVKALVALVPAGLLFSGSAFRFAAEKTAPTFLQLVGAGGVGIVVLCHVCEAWHLFPWMQWGLEHSIGHYIDLFAAVLGLTLFPAGYLLGSLRRRA